MGTSGTCVNLLLEKREKKHSFSASVCFVVTFLLHNANHTQLTFGPLLLYFAGYISTEPVCQLVIVVKT